MSFSTRTVPIKTTKRTILSTGYSSTLNHVTNTNTPATSSSTTQKSTVQQKTTTKPLSKRKYYNYKHIYYLFNTIIRKNLQKVNINYVKWFYLNYVTSEKYS